MIQETLTILPTEDNEQIALWEIKNPQAANNKNIFLTHGTFSDKRICLGIAKYLAEKGFVCWIMEWRNHGASGKTTQSFNFETIALWDIKAAFHYLYNGLNIKNLHCITHSGGGICLTMFLIKHPVYIPSINSISFFGCQAFGAAVNRQKYWGITVNKWVTKLIGFIPGKLNGRPHNENYHTMKQWFDWNLQRNFKGKDNFDYLPKMPLVNCRILSICGAGDTAIAPIEGCQTFLDAFKKEHNQLLYGALKHGFLEDYDHGRIMLSKGAAQEIWPVVLEWINR